jgi:hypothetical protein
MNKALKNYNMTFEVYDGLLYTKYFFDKAFLDMMCNDLEDVDYDVIMRHMRMLTQKIKEIELKHSHEKDLLSID